MKISEKFQEKIKQEVREEGLANYLFFNKGSDYSFRNIQEDFKENTVIYKVTFLGHDNGFVKIDKEGNVLETGKNIKIIDWGKTNGTNRNS